MGVNEWVAAAKAEIDNLSADEVAAELERGEAIVVDIRDIRELWRDGTIPGARHAARGMLEFWADPESHYHKDWLQPGRRTILFCAGGQRSALSAKTLKDLGYADVGHLEIGFNAWKEQGRPVVPVEKR